MPINPRRPTKSSRNRRETIHKNNHSDKMTDINRLLNKYYRPDGKNRTGNIKINNAEIISNEYDKTLKSDNRRKHRHLLLDELLNETPFHLHENHITQIRYWIDHFNTDFKDFHRRASNETIIKKSLPFVFEFWKRPNKP